MKPVSRASFAGTAAVAAVLCLLAACGPRVSDTPGADVTLADPGLLEMECERALQHLASLITLRSGEGAFPRHRIIEASALHDTASELYAEGEFQIALELIDEAVTLLGDV